MSDYRVGDGFDLSLGALTVLSPQPRSEGIQVTQRTYAPTAIFDQGLYIELVYDLIDDATALQAILTDYGLNSAEINEVTVYIPDPVGTLTRYNGRAVRPIVSHRDYFYRNVIVLVKDLTPSA